jgi:glutamine---fructose-6-phosphate transaminase (isomerizing)
MSLDSEIAEQPDVAARLLRDASGPVRRIADAVADKDISGVVIAARGTSDHAAVYGQYVLGARNRLVVALATPSVTSVYGVAPRFDGALVVGISQSGASPDIVGVIDAARDQGCPTIAITNDPGSPLATSAEHVIALGAGSERAVAATKTYTAELLAIAMLSVALEGRDPASDPELAAVPGAVERALRASEPETVAKELARMRQALVVGRGFEYATAREWALKLKELARVFAEPYSAADLAHGPIAVLDPGARVLAIAPSGATEAAMRELLVALRDEIGTDALVLSDLPELRDLGRWSIPLPGGLPEWLAPISTIVPAQRFTVALARAAGLDPERPRHIRKVTLTV